MNADTLRRWWSRRERRTGRAWNVGAALPASWVVLDLDGPEAPDVLHSEGLSIPTTATVATGRGLHLWYHAERPIASATGVLPHVDVKGLGGYVLASASVHATGRTYSWVRPLADAVDAPGWLYELAPAAGAAAGRSLADLLADPVAEGQGRNVALSRFAGAMFRTLEPRLALAACAWLNRERFRPPLEPAEFGATVASIAAREARRRVGGGA